MWRKVAKTLGGRSTTPWRPTEAGSGPPSLADLTTNMLGSVVLWRDHVHVNVMATDGSGRPKEELALANYMDVPIVVDLGSTTLSFTSRLRSN